MLLFWSATALAGFGGAEVGLTGEIDKVGNEFLLDATVDPWATRWRSSRLTWARIGVSWAVVPSTERLDRLELTALHGVQTFGSGSAGAWWDGGGFRYDQEDQLLDIVFAAGGVWTQVGEGLTLDIGVDTRLRVVNTDLEGLRGGGSDSALFIGLPLGLTYRYVTRDPLYTELKAAFRPSFGLLGDEVLTFDGSASGRIGARVVDESEAIVDIYMHYTFRMDTFTALDPTLEHRAGLGVDANF